MGISGEGAKSVAHIVVTTNLSCAAGLLTATIVSWLVLGKPDFSMTVNGALAGLVAITAPCAFVNPMPSVIIGIIAGVLVVFSVLFFDKIRMDDPVGALSVHLTNGIWGTLAVGLFAEATLGGIGVNGLFYGGGVDLLIGQFVGVIAVGVFTFTLALLVWTTIKATLGLRVEQETETIGLDISEMGMEAYPNENPFG